MTAMFYMMSINILKTILPYFAKDIGATEILISHILYIGFLAFAFFSPVAGRISDYFGYKKTIVIAAIIEALLLSMYVLVSNYMELLIIRMLQALFEVLLSASFLHLASTYAKRTGIYIGYLRIAQALGMATGPLLVFVISTFSHKEFILLSSFLCLAPLSTLLLEEPETNRDGKDGMHIIKYVTRRELVPLYLCAISEVFSVSVLFFIYRCGCNREI